MIPTKLVIGIVSARQYRERRARCRRLWTHELGLSTDVIWRFFVGKNPADASFVPESEPDVVELDCPDDYVSLPQKTFGMIQWFRDRYEFNHLFKCDDDTYVKVERLLRYVPPADYCGWSVRRTFKDAPEVASGGAGYMLSSRAAALAAEAMKDHKTGPEDSLLGQALASREIPLHHDERFCFNAHPGMVPAPDNEVITAHWVNSPESEAIVRRPWEGPTAVHKPLKPKTGEQDLVLQIGSRRIRWIIGPQHDREFVKRVLLPWAAPQAVRLPSDARADFTVGVYPASKDDVTRVRDAPGMRFLLAGEPETRYSHGDGCFQMVQQPREQDDAWTRYAPILCLWAPPVDRPAKLRPCSAIESKKRPWRFALFEQLRANVPELEGFGSAYNRPLGGYHCVGSDPKVYSKFEGLAPYAFTAAAERLAAPDYLTEKFADGILCETIPLYTGCTNIDEYVIPGCYHPLALAHELSWSDWPTEYARRRPAVLRQKELIRTHFNVLSYFIYLTGRLELLDHLRPITLATIDNARMSAMQAVN